jgi:hypothetical protein
MKRRTSFGSALGTIALGSQHTDFARMADDEYGASLALD